MLCLAVIFSLIVAGNSLIQRSVYHDLSNRCPGSALERIDSWPCWLKPRLHQGNIRATCCRQHVAGNMLPVYRQQLLFIYVTVDLYPFVSSNRRATNWQQFCCRQRVACSNMHVDGNSAGQHVTLVYTRLNRMFTHSRGPWGMWMCFRIFRLRQYCRRENVTRWCSWSRCAGASRWPVRRHCWPVPRHPIRRSAGRTAALRRPRPFGSPAVRYADDSSPF